MDSFSFERLSARAQTPLEESIHLVRYWALRDVVKDKVVLDLGCGEGFGSSLLADYASRVIAIDADQTAIDEARVRFPSDKIDFLRCDAERVADHVDLSQISVVVACEVLEHVFEPELCLRRISDSLPTDAVFFATVPNDELSYRYRSDDNPVHLRKFTKSSFIDQVSEYFGPPTSSGSGLASFGFTLLSDTIDDDRTPIDSLALISQCGEPNADNAHFWWGLWGADLASASVLFPRGEVAAALAYDFASLELPWEAVESLRVNHLEKRVAQLEVELAEACSTLWVMSELIALDPAGRGLVDLVALRAPLRGARAFRSKIRPAMMLVYSRLPPRIQNRIRSVRSWMQSRRSRLA